MCVHLMRIYGIYRVYFSNENGEICCQRVNRIDSDEWDHMSRGLTIMVVRQGNMLKSGRLPLTKKQKTLIRQGVG